jgi:hypothetical protein
LADEEEVLPPPLEIPWQLASTTQPLAAGEPDETAISLFVYEPDDDAIRRLFPGQRIVYLKLTTTISPATVPANLPRIAGAVLGEGVPCYHVLLDVRVRGAVGTIRPYFHAAAPLSRRAIQSGVVGVEVIEGESDEQFAGRSGSQLYEASSSRASTTTVGGGASGIGPLSIGASARRTSTDVSGERAVSQVVDQTTRDASQERRELTSHHTKVENILTLLNAKYVGTPHLRFSLSPRPLELLSIDPSDPNLWFNQLLHRRSSGIEGIQEYTAVVLVPEDEDFCIDVRLRRVCVLDVPPGPFTGDERFVFNQHLGRLLNYIHRAFPIGTPLEELDIDITDALQPNLDEFVRPVLETWWVTPVGLLLAGVVSPGKQTGSVQRRDINYKHMLELWLETLRDEYEREVARSPLERGFLMGEDRMLDTCFAFTQAGPVVTDSSASVTPAFLIHLDDSDLDLGGISAAASSVRADVRQRAYEAVMRWNLLDERLAILLSNRRKAKPRDFTLDDGRVVGVLVELWAKLASDDPRNLGFDAAAEALALTATQRRTLKAAGATDLRTIAQAIRAAPVLSRYNETVAELRRTRKRERGEPALPDAVKGVVPADAAQAMLRGVAKNLERVRTKRPVKK